MDQGSDYIRQDIEATRAALGEKLDTLETKARETFDLKHHMDEHPWLLLGGAFAAGYVVGSAGSAEDDHAHEQSFSTTGYAADSGRSAAAHGDSFLSQFDDEIKLLKTAAVSTIVNLLHDSIRAYIPAIGEQLQRVAQERSKSSYTGPEASARPTTSPYGSFSEASASGSSFSQSTQERAVGSHS